VAAAEHYIITCHQYMLILRHFKGDGKHLCKIPRSAVKLFYVCLLAFLTSYSFISLHTGAFATPICRARTLRTPPGCRSLPRGCITWFLRLDNSFHIGQVETVKASNQTLMWRRTRWDMPRLSLWRRSNKHVNEAEFGSNFMSTSTA